MPLTVSAITIRTTSVTNYSQPSREHLVYLTLLPNFFVERPDIILGAGAGFALEDVYVLTRAVKWAHERRLPIHDGLEIFDKVRSPYYKDMVCFREILPYFYLKWRE